ncbi:hypothetical protein HMPREF0208_04380 [Citrobacter koseri]|nr:hypothetical protein HMPREF3207_04290 [Citrobacter koseri]KXB40508.1 hypothetical protein HMPREF0208_04380 [Citrobacter koseri]
MPPIAAAPRFVINLLSDCQISYSKIIKIGYVLAEYAAKARVAYH